MLKDKKAELAAVIAGNLMGCVPFPPDKKNKELVIDAALEVADEILARTGAFKQVEKKKKTKKETADDS